MTNMTTIIVSNGARDQIEFELRKSHMQFEITNAIRVAAYALCISRTDEGLTQL